MAVEKKGSTYLHLAAGSGHIVAFKEVLNEKVDKNIRNESFCFACKNGRINIVQLLLKYADLEVDWIDLNSTNKKGYTGLHWACKQGHSAIINMLIDGAEALDIDLNATNKSGKTNVQKRFQYNFFDQYSKAALVGFSVKYIAP